MAEFGDEAVNFLKMLIKWWALLGMWRWFDLILTRIELLSYICTHIESTISRSTAKINFNIQQHPRHLSSLETIINSLNLFIIKKNLKLKQIWIFYIHLLFISKYDEHWRLKKIIKKLLKYSKQSSISIE